MANRCAWVGDDPLFIQYHDLEWGLPVHDDRVLFEFLILEGAQAGLSWSTILRKRENYRKAYDNFDPQVVARYDEAKVAALLADPGIVRNRRKVAASIENARRLPGNPAGVRQLRCLHLGLRRRLAAAQRLAQPLRDPRPDARSPGAQQGPDPPRLPFRRSHDHVCPHAGYRHGQRPYCRLFSLCGVKRA